MDKENLLLEFLKSKNLIIKNGKSYFNNNIVMKNTENEKQNNFYITNFFESKQKNLIDEHLIIPDFFIFLNEKKFSEKEILKLINLKMPKEDSEKYINKILNVFIKKNIRQIPFNIMINKNFLIKDECFKLLDEYLNFFGLMDRYKIYEKCFSLKQFQISVNNQNKLYKLICKFDNVDRFQDKFTHLNNIDGDLLQEKKSVFLEIDLIKCNNLDLNKDIGFEQMKNYIEIAIQNLKTFSFLGLDDICIMKEDKKLKVFFVGENISHEFLSPIVEKQIKEIIKLRQNDLPNKCFLSENVAEILFNNILLNNSINNTQTKKSIRV